MEFCSCSFMTLDPEFDWMLRFLLERPARIRDVQRLHRSGGKA